MSKFVYAFEEGGREQKFLLGGKGANLAEMTNLGLPVPPGFTITTEACKVYMARGDTMPEGLMDEVAGALDALEQNMGKKLGDVTDPLLVSVRSGAPFSMPGMMDTVLNLGLNDTSVQGLAKQTDNERFAYDSYRRFVQMAVIPPLGYIGPFIALYFGLSWVMGRDQVSLPDRLAKSIVVIARYKPSRQPSGA